MIASSGSYTWFTTVYNGTGCSLGAGDEDAIMYKSFGNAVVAGLASTPVGAVNIEFTQSSSYQQILVSPDEAQWKTDLGALCARTFTNADTNMNNVECTGGTITSQVFGTNGSKFYNIVTLDNGLLSMGLGDTFIKPGRYVSYPTSLDKDLQ